MKTVNWTYRKFDYKRPSGTSRGILTEKHTWYLELKDGSREGLGEFNVIPGLTPEYASQEEYQHLVEQVCEQLQHEEWEIWKSLGEWMTSETYSIVKTKASLVFAIENALLDLWSTNGVLFDNAFAKKETKIPINGLIWMGEVDFMLEQAKSLHERGFNCIKLKIGSRDWTEELEVLRQIRELYSNEELILRVDANGAFPPMEALAKLEELAQFKLHSIEQPIAVNQWKAMRALCEFSPVAIALDEELIGVHDRKKKIELLDAIRPPYIILKPSLHGGITGCQEWIHLASERNIPYWITSALESNVGLNCIAQFTGNYDTSIHHGLGTGSLFTENTESDLTVDKGMIFKA